MGKSKSIEPPMTYEEVMDRLNAVQSDQIKTIYLRRAPDAKVIGVRFGDMYKLVKPNAGNTELARKLWAEGSMEPRFLALRIIDPADFSEAEIDKWMKEIDSPILADNLANAVYKTRFAKKKLAEWTDSESEYFRKAGYGLLFNFAADPSSEISNEEFETYLDRIATEIHDSPNWARESMNSAPIAIGLRNPELFEPAMAACQAFGKVDVFHGEKTNCKVIDPIAALEDPRTKIPRPA